MIAVNSHAGERVWNGEAYELVAQEAGIEFWHQAFHELKMIAVSSHAAQQVSN
ncbi:hypothetical protein [Erwinia pyrifoliae]|uniref:hypothetical protein n=1 Tax=Erwinia pyrifoliae TaxID=79967 RepID=UPI0012FF411A|nr:hypothetical protein [Erwinia pyrifoliae]MCT2386578.1 hypothetical protein [Erwinia pyrifoliae]MCU8587825.1 hypothetical protein [Erwinia pyrifoliae]UWS31618.1 hypothetical protein NYP81_09370 [Erwinia pyrifoliae]UXK11193.1 hypothetical protein NYP80_12735 [Erwinia pyrifoliae]